MLISPPLSYPEFFITSTVVDGIVIENRIGDALVNRIIQARDEGTAWRACIVIPTLPGYTYPIDSDAASSVSLRDVPFLVAGIRPDAFPLPAAGSSDRRVSEQVDLPRTQLDFRKTEAGGN